MASAEKNLQKMRIEDLTRCSRGTSSAWIAATRAITTWSPTASGKKPGLSQASAAARTAWRCGWAGRWSWATSRRSFRRPGRAGRIQNPREKREAELNAKTHNNSTHRMPLIVARRRGRRSVRNADTANRDHERVGLRHPEAIWRRLNRSKESS